MMISLYIYIILNVFFNEVMYSRLHNLNCILNLKLHSRLHLIEKYILNCAIKTDFFYILYSMYKLEENFVFENESSKIQCEINICIIKCTF